MDRDLQPAHTRPSEKGQGAAVFRTRPNLKEENAAHALIDNKFHSFHRAPLQPGLGDGIDFRIWLTFTV